MTKSSADVSEFVEWFYERQEDDADDLDEEDELSDAEEAGRAAGRMPRLRMPGRIQSGNRPDSIQKAWGARPMVGRVMAWFAWSSACSGRKSQAASVRPNRRTSKARIRAVSPAPRRNSAATARAVRRLASVVVDKDGISG